jgi:hypothetical protein
VTDNFKDVRERLGESVTNSAFDQKSGKWKGGNGYRQRYEPVRLEQEADRSVPG